MNLADEERVVIYSSLEIFRIVSPQIKFSRSRSVKIHKLHKIL